MEDLSPLLGAIAGVAAGLGFWLYRRRRVERRQIGDARLRLAVSPAPKGQALVHRVQGPWLTDIDGSYVIGDNSATRAEIEEFMARGSARSQ